ncbi:MAG: deoxyribodipyrimidine photo-lyase [Pseudomonadota bacterium]
MLQPNKRAQLAAVWFKRDLRSVDHQPLTAAAQSGAPVLPLYIAEPDWWAQPDMSGRQWAFISETLHELREDLQSLGQPLVVRTGDVVKVLSELHAEFGLCAVYAHEEIGGAWTFERDKRVSAWLAQQGIALHEYQQGGVVRRLKSRNGWAKRWDATMAQAITEAPSLSPIATIDPGPIPDASKLGLPQDPCPERQPGGRSHGLERLQSFISDRGAPYRKAMSSPAAGALACSRISPYLAWGALSMREVAQTTWARQRELKQAPPRSTGPWRGAMVSFSGRLHWRCHFMQKLEDEPRLEFNNLHAAYDGLRPKSPDATRLAAWCAGETGLPFVDACMRALSSSGWMNFRMRAMLTAVASYHLWLDWRLPGEHLARLFTDYEPGIHWPQIQMQSGTTGINTIRIYNPIKQGYDQDPNGDFVRRWIPELAAVPDEFIHEPWKWDQSGMVLDRRYPFPIVDHLKAAKEARQKIWGVRGGSGFRRKADQIQEKHGSRKSGMPMTGRRPRKKSPKADSAQLSLGLEGETP